MAPADLVYTGRGAILWLQDLDAWAAVLRRLLAPAGRLVIFDGHPAEWLFDADEDGRWILTDYDYSRVPRPRAAGRRSTSTASRSPRMTSTSSSRARGHSARS